ncbi:aspartate aminotransferase [Volvox carteri f. nagariensis]|uniref:Aspartate aminotransferase n=1 Tax=Volvox carteri f. nagariensis TaxID=3068 RepID=D8U7Y1_VOLCA|nr:aspartate aminotransferase [Volvox carteri f. nagariensis]EFJ44120.1 aspartate aminotransferase [Volvox carteri f. nagariensis]|eukprot:XP_002954714.1 aspartate aminotransferase [Volvox carteri f. nagariensis]
MSPEDRMEVLTRQLCAGQSTESNWEHVQQAPPDPIIGVTDAWRADPDPRKLNLGVGAYRTEEGKPYVLKAVREAEQQILADPAMNKEYLPISGNPEFNRLARTLALGPGSSAIQQNRVATVQALSGTGALRVGAEFLSMHLPASIPRIVYLPNPTWGNHKSIFAKAGFQVREYRYFDAATRGLNFAGMVADVSAAPPGSVLLLHACAHNPTGVDPSPEQWSRLLEVARSGGLVPFFDMAYQGFASGDLDADAASVRLFLEAGLELVLAQSFAKNMGLYGERAGALSVVSKTKEVATRVESQLKLVVRPMYSNPPMHGAAIAARVMGDPKLNALWKEELRGMAERIKSMRQVLYDQLVARNVPGDWSFVLKQIGMFSFTGMTRHQCEQLVSKWHVHLTLDGRISMAGLSAATAPYLAEAIADVIQNA